MAVPLSIHKANRIIKLFLNGYPQTAIANKMGVSQATVSNYTAMFARQVEGNGLSSAVKEVDMSDEVASLRSLSVELYRSGLTLEEAKQGHDMINAFQKLGISPERHQDLVKICGEIDDPGFIKVALELSRIKVKSGTSFQQVMDKFQQAREQLPQLEEKLAGTKADLQVTSDAREKEQQKLVEQQQVLLHYREKVKVEKSKLKNELSAYMKLQKITKEEVTDAATLKAELKKKGLTLPTLITLAKEFGHGKESH